jgi:hypothetical protein
MQKDKIIVVDYLNIYTLLIIRARGCKSVVTLYEHLFMEGVYKYILRVMKVKILKLDMDYGSNRVKLFLNIKEEKERIVHDSFSTGDVMSDFLYKKFFFEKIHPIVEIKYILKRSEFQNNWDLILINYKDYLTEICKKDEFYPRVKYYNLPVLIKKNKSICFYRPLYVDRMFLFLRSIAKNIVKIIYFRFSSHRKSEANLIVISKRRSNILDSCYLLNIENINNILIDPVTLKVTSNNDMFHLHSVNGIHDLYNDILDIISKYKKITIRGVGNFEMKLNFISEVKDIVFLNKVF